MSKRRHACYLYRTKSDRQPSRMGALAVGSFVRPDTERETRRELALDTWQLETWSARSGIPGPSHVRTGANAHDFWECLWSQCAGADRTVILCPRLIRALSLLGAWGEIDRGRIYLHRYPMMLADPPTALEISRTASSGSVLLLDSRNFGVDVGTAEQAPGAVGWFARAMVKALGECGLGSLQMTVGSQAMYGYRRSYMRVRPYTHMRPEALTLERAALHGGRAECYRLGFVDGPVYHLDWTGFYASIMAEIAVPVRLLHYGSTWSAGTDRLQHDGARLIARVRVKTEWPHLPCVRDGLTVYPVGTWWTVLAGPDLDAADEAGEIIDRGEWAAYDCSPALYDFARAMTRLRQSPACQDNLLLRQWAKALAVTLVGKWAQERVTWEDRPGCRLPGPWGTWPYLGTDGHWKTLRSVAGLVQAENRGGETPTSCPAIAAWIYAEGRRRLWGAQLVAGRDHVLYSNTDSLFVDALGYQALLLAGMVGSGEPGRLRLVDAWDWIELLGVSHYRTPTRTVCSGHIGSGHTGQDVTEPGWYSETAGISLAGKHAPRPIERRGPKARVSPYLHGVRTEEGRVEPWRV